MKTQKNFLIEQDTQGEYLFEMANLFQTTTHLPMMIWLQYNSPTETGRPDCPRLTFQNNKATKHNGELIPISIDRNEPKILLNHCRLQITQTELAELQTWIRKNYDALMKVWNQEIDAVEFATKYMKE